MPTKRKIQESDRAERVESQDRAGVAESEAEGARAVAEQRGKGPKFAQPSLQPSSVYFAKTDERGAAYGEGLGTCFGLIETRGFLPLVVAADAMLKAANIHLLRYERVMGELAAICVVGDISAVRIAVESGIATAETYGEVVASAVLSNPDPAVTQVLAGGRTPAGEEGVLSPRQSAIGILETRGFVCAIVALDSMLKAASVRFCGFENTAAGAVAPIVTGDLSAVRYAVDAGVEAVSRVGEVIASQVLARPQVTQESVLPVSEANLNRLIPPGTRRLSPSS